MGNIPNHKVFFLCKIFLTIFKNDEILLDKNFGGGIGEATKP